MKDSTPHLQKLFHFHLFRTPIIKYLLITILFTFFISSNLNSEDNLDQGYRTLRNIDEQINELTISIRRDNIGWGWEIITSNQTNVYQRRYLELKAKLDPWIIGATRDVRERVFKLKTMGQALASIPGLVSDMSTTVDYETRLNHIEFLITSRRSIISARRSILIAFFSLFLSLYFGLTSFLRSASANKRFKEIEKQNKNILSRLNRFPRFLAYSFSLFRKHRHRFN